MYDKSDPRAALTAAAKAPAATRLVGAEFGLFYETDPQVQDASGKTWLTRGQNFLVAYSELAAGGILERTAQPDEYVVIFPDRERGGVIEANGERHEVAGYSLVIVPPGASRVTSPAGGRVVRIFSTQAADLCALCANAESYAEAHPNIPPFKPWPEPKGGYRVRSYSLDVPAQPGRFGRIFRCTTLMVNVLDPQMGPRDITKLSPHHHDDFEQGSLALDGAFTHHLRWPWTTDLNAWREDQHALVRSPSLIVIPPPAIHTSRGMEQGLNQLVDIFSPPREDFSKQSGWVLNGDEYPMPGE
ncbi:hypothetical protein [Rhodoligotrophos defluvii]|uniref:hypothetical protein n=1 Tax=Rhodoligotrophos defluvii TaxID=2561934 RepID=UPI0010C98DD3|nr:hypothetical protein [Rhodoligotrophos defluvii]